MAIGARGTNPKESVRPLFDGVSLEGWKTTGNPEGWIAEDGKIVCLAKKGGYLYTEEKYEDYVLSLEFNIGPNANSGVFVRLSDVNDPVNAGIEVQILDDESHKDRIKPTQKCGALYDMVPPSVDAMKPLGEWNQMSVTCHGPKISVELNGHAIAEMNVDDYSVPGENPDGTKNKYKYAWKEMPRLGHIALQDHNSQVWFRNIEIQRIS